MISYRKIVLYLLFIVSICYIVFNINMYKNKNIEINKTVIGKVTYIKKQKDKTVFDIKSDNKYRITVYNDFNYELGDTLKIVGVFKTPSNNSVFNLFNYKKYLLSKKIYVICNNGKITLVSKNNNFLYMIKNKMTNHIDKYKSKKYIKTFIMGDTSDIEKDILENYRYLGISHLLAISGMHVSVFLIIINFLFKRFKYKNIIIFLFMMFLIFITNYPESLLRCFLFMIIKYINHKLNLKYSNIDILIFTFCLLIFYNVYYIYSIGFWFSFIITFFILISNKLLINKSYFIKLILISVICFLSSIPILASSFYKINIITPLFNIIFVPIISIIIFPLGLLTFIFPVLDNFYYVLTFGMETFINTFSKIRIFTYVISKPNIIYIFLYYLILIFSIKKDRKIIILFVVVLVFNINSKCFINHKEVTFLDVGQGDSSLIIMPKGNATLIDTGGLYNSNYSIVLNKTIPYLNSLGINKLDTLILTHGDYDHMGEAINLVNNFKVEKVIFNCGEYNELEQGLIKILNKKKIPYYSCIKKINIDKNKLYFLQTKDYDNENDNSNVIYTEINGYKFMFMGDAGVEKEKDILDKYNVSDVDVLKVGHHGSKTSSGEDFINEMNPKYSIISVGKNNRYGHPNKEVLDNLKNSKIYRTDQEGSIMFKIKNNELKIETCSS